MALAILVKGPIAPMIVALTLHRRWATLGPQGAVDGSGRLGLGLDRHRSLDWPLGPGHHRGQRRRLLGRCDRRRPGAQTAAWRGDPRRATRRPTPSCAAPDAGQRRLRCCRSGPCRRLAVEGWEPGCASLWPGSFQRGLRSKATPTKLIHYPLPLYGALAWLMAKALEKTLERWPRWIGAALAAVAALAFAAAGPYARKSARRRRRRLAGRRRRPPSTSPALGAAAWLSDARATRYAALRRRRVSDSRRPRPAAGRRRAGTQATVAFEPGGARPRKRWRQPG